MLIRLKQVRRITRDRFRVTLDLVDPDRAPWQTGDCTVRIDVLDAPRHDAVPRGLLRPALELYRLCPEAPPATADARLLWDMGEAVHAYVGRLFEAGILCPFGVGAESAPERSE
jgi:hypothetical protein